MTPEELTSRTAELFHEALMRTPDRQSTFLAEACEGDEELFGKVKQLLEAYAGITGSSVASMAGQNPVSVSQSPDVLLALGERYDDIEFIGQGGMGLVFRARDREINKVVALKLLHPGLARDERVIERFRNEIRLALDITHKNVCRTYGLDRVDGTILISMEYVDGETLRSILDRVKGVSVQQGLVWSLEICEALAAAHEQKIVHRDLKPENIMIDRAGHVRVMDFGIARSLDAGESSAAGTIIGTPNYMSPEQAMGKTVGPTSDIYSLGLILYELFAGARRGPTHPVPPGEVNPYIPSYIDRAIRKSLAENVLDRFQTVNELAAGLAARPKRASARTAYRYAIWAALGMLGVLLVGGVALKYWKPSAQRPMAISHDASASRLPAAPSATTVKHPPAPTGSAGLSHPAAEHPISVPAKPSNLRKPSAGASLDGVWSATFADAKTNAVLQMNVVENAEGEVVGTYTTSLGGGGSIKGNVKYDVLTVELTQTVTNCPGIFKGTASVGRDKAEGSYSGSDCLGDHGHGTFTMTKGVQVLTERAQLRENLGPYLRSKFLVWMVEDAQIVLGTPSGLKNVVNEVRNIKTDVYTFPNPTSQIRQIELAFDSSTKRLMEAYLYSTEPMTWAQCVKQWGDKTESIANPDGSRTEVYNNLRIRVHLDKDDNVISIALF